VRLVAKKTSPLSSLVARLSSTFVIEHIISLDRRRHVRRGPGLSIIDQPSPYAEIVAEPHVGCRRRPWQNEFYTDRAGNKRKALINTDAVYHLLLQEFSATFLTNRKGYETRSFDLLEDGEAYTLGGHAVSLAPSQMSRILTAPAPPTREIFDCSSLLRMPMDMQFLRVQQERPEFTCEEGWAEATTDTMSSHVDDDGDLPVPPMLLARCSRGGRRGRWRN
jgi:hypothetical protein